MLRAAGSRRRGSVPFHGCNLAAPAPLRSPALGCRLCSRLGAQRRPAPSRVRLPRTRGRERGRCCRGACCSVFASLPHVGRPEGGSILLLPVCSYHGLGASASAAQPVHLPNRVAPSGAAASFEAPPRAAGLRLPAPLRGQGGPRRGQGGMGRLCRGQLLCRTGRPGWWATHDPSAVCRPLATTVLHAHAGSRPRRARSCSLLHRRRAGGRRGGRRRGDPPR